ncbi:hypothetical protein [Microbacterium xylanilyticum]
MSVTTRTVAPPHRGRAARPLAALLAAAALIAAPVFAPPAYADDYPSWQDVQNA